MAVCVLCLLGVMLAPAAGAPLWAGILGIGIGIGMGAGRDARP
ncbi:MULTISPECIES: hypothetical protein [unclassified Kitasatospora]